jgi:hypothetical protein
MSIISTIQKLLALSQSNNEAEASVAMEKAQALLLKYNLEWKDVDESSPKREKREHQKLTKSAMYDWQRKLWRKIAETNFCMYWTVDVFDGKKYVKRHQVLGSESNVASVTLMGEYLCNAIERMLPYPNKERLSRSALSWRNGCVDRLVQRLQERHDRLQTETTVNAEGHEIALRSIYEREHELNYDAAYGEGAWMRRQQEQAQRQREWDEALKEMRENPQVEQCQEETPAEKRRREKEEAKQKAWWKRYQESQKRKREQAYLKVDWHAYQQGSVEADNINLDAQIKSGTVKGKLS